MSKKKGKPRREKLRSVSAESLAARISGVVVHENRRGTLLRLIDTAITDWFLERDPFAIHLTVCACYLVLADLGKDNGKGPALEKSFGRFKMTAVYDFLRHAKPNMLTDSVDLVPKWNDILIFESIESFRRLFDGTTARMRTFQAYYSVRPTFVHSKLPQNADAFLPESVSVREADRLASLGRVTFFTELTEVFAQEILRSQQIGNL